MIAFFNSAKKENKLSAIYTLSLIQTHLKVLNVNSN